MQILGALYDAPIMWQIIWSYSGLKTKNHRLESWTRFELIKKNTHTHKLHVFSDSNYLRMVNLFDNM